MKFCTNCGARNHDGAKFCTTCGKTFAQKRTPVSPKTENNTGNAFLNFFFNYIGTPKSDLNWRILFTDIFKPHTHEEAEDIFICGTKRTTPDPSLVLSEMPKPWFYSRVFAVFLATFILLWICCTQFRSELAIPGLIMVGALAVPLSIMILFLELNVWKDFSLYNVIVVFLIGGCASLVATLFLFSIFPTNGEGYVAAIIIGVIEEAGKAIIVYFFLKGMKAPTILRALLVGSCVGAGFSAFESAGYAFRYLLGSSSFSQMMHTTILRSFLAPGGHVVWAAISGAGMVIAAKAAYTTINTDTLTDSRFWRIFAIPVILHALWDSPLGQSFLPDLHGGLIFLVLCAWIVVLILINMGLAEVEQRSRRY